MADHYEFSSFEVRLLVTSARELASALAANGAVSTPTLGENLQKMANALQYGICKYWCPTCYADVTHPKHVAVDPLEQLQAIREALQFANDSPLITDTLWLMHRPQTVLEALDEVIALLVNAGFDSLEELRAGELEYESWRSFVGVRPEPLWPFPERSDGVKGPEHG